MRRVTATHVGGGVWRPEQTRYVLYSLELSKHSCEALTLCAAVNRKQREGEREDPGNVAASFQLTLKSSIYLIPQCVVNTGVNVTALSCIH